MTVQSKMARARAAIEAFNASASTKVDIDSFEAKIRADGAHDEATLALVSWEDLKGYGLPLFLAKQVAIILRGDEPGEKSDFISPRKADRMTFEQLIEQYRPEDDNAVSQKLKTLSYGKRFIVFHPDGIVDVPASLHLLLELRKGLPDLTVHLLDGRPRPTYRVGDRPNTEVDENPLYPGRALRTDEVCDQTQRSWKGVPMVVRQLLYIAITRTRELRVDTLMNAHDIMDRAINRDEKTLRGFVPRASIELDEALRKGVAPRLKIDIKSPGLGSSQAQSPFFGAERKNT